MRKWKSIVGRMRATIGRERMVNVAASSEQTGLLSGNWQQGGHELRTQGYAPRIPVSPPKAAQLDH